MDVFKYMVFIRYLLFFLTLFIIIFTIKVIINSNLVDKQIFEANKQIKKLKNNEFFYKNFYNKYLNTDIYKYFVFHENGLHFLSGEKKYIMDNIDIIQKNVKISYKYFNDTNWLSIIYNNFIKNF